MSNQKKTTNFKIGDKVWFYFGTSVPLEGEVVGVGQTIHVKYKFGKVPHHKDNIYMRPDDYKVLFKQMEEDCDHLKWSLATFENNNKHLA
jgi:hypothetical protein